MIKVEGLTKKYARTVAVDNISFEVEKGGIVGFLGPNGAGKTTTMRVLTCFLPPPPDRPTWPDSMCWKIRSKSKSGSGICRNRRRCTRKWKCTNILRLSV